jgi:hypothetical protein
MAELPAKWGLGFFCLRLSRSERVNYFSGAMQLSPGIFIHLDLCGD